MAAAHRRVKARSRLVIAGDGPLRDELAARARSLGIEDAATAIDLFDAMTDAQAQAERSWLLTMPSYRAALDRLGQRRG